MGYKTGYILSRNGNWFYWRRVPKDLQHCIPIRLLRTSLKTKSQKDAEQLARQKDALVERVFVLLRSGMLDDTQRQRAITELTGAKKQSVHTLRTTLGIYIKDRSPGLSNRTRSEYAIRAGSIETFLGDRLINSITRGDILILRDKLTTTLAAATVNKYLSWLHTFFGWCVDCRYVDSNPAAGVTRVKDSSKRGRFTVAELQALHRLIQPHRQSTNYPERYWVPLISLLMGLRMTEVLQLQRTDLQRQNGIWCVSINGRDGKEVKTASSERIVPVHPALIDLGFLEYAKQRIGPLWPSMAKCNNKAGRISGAFTCWFSQHIRGAITSDRDKTFHSLRHTFVDELKQADIPEQAIAELVGHSRGSITMERYGKRYQPEHLFKVISTINFSMLLGLERKDAGSCSGVA